jgi:hypothetical protein
MSAWGAGHFRPLRDYLTQYSIRHGSKGQARPDHNDRYTTRQEFDSQLEPATGFLGLYVQGVFICAHAN